MLGVDGGGTGVRAVRLQGGKQMADWLLPPMNYFVESDVTDRLYDLIETADVEVAGIGLCGVTKEASLQIQAELTSRTGVPTVVVNDGDVAWFSAFLGLPGIVVFAGTGSGALGMGQDSKRFWVGGNGFLLGDEGSGYWLGRSLVAMALRSRDGTGIKSAAAEELVAAAFGGLHAAVITIHQNPTKRTLLTDLVPSMAESTSPEILRLLDDGAEHLIKLGTRAREELGDLPIAMVGGVFQVQRIASRFMEATNAQCPKLSPTEGAAALAMTQLGFIRHPA